MAGDITEINLKDPARTVVMEVSAPSIIVSSVNDADGPDILNQSGGKQLEANNLVDEKNNVKKGKYFDEGYVDDGPSGPGFFENLGNMIKKK
eukprot:9487555-Pyramimonas_sp.AAC.2